MQTCFLQGQRQTHRSSGEDHDETGGAITADKRNCRHAFMYTRQVILACWVILSENSCLVHHVHRCISIHVPTSTVTLITPPWRQMVSCLVLQPCTQGTMQMQVRGTYHRIALHDSCDHGSTSAGHPRGKQNAREIPTLLGPRVLSKYITENAYVVQPSDSA